MSKSLSHINPTPKSGDKKFGSQNDGPSSSGHELSTELNDLIFELVETIHNMGWPTPVTKKQSKIL